MKYKWWISLSIEELDFFTCLMVHKRWRYLDLTPITTLLMRSEMDVHIFEKEKEKEKDIFMIFLVYIFMFD